MTETVMSPGGDTIEIVEDDDWVQMTGITAKVLAFWDSKGPILETLWLHGPYEDRHGSATGELFADAKARGYSSKNQRSFSGRLSSPGLAPAIDRDTRAQAKRTYRIALTALPRVWLSRLEKVQPSTNGDAVEPEGFGEPIPVDPDTHERLDVIEPEPDGDDYTGEPYYEADALRLDVAQSVATALLAQVIDIVSTGKPDASRLEALTAERDALSARLATALEYGQRSARDARAAADQLVAVKSERDGLRTRLRQAEANLQKTLSPANARTLDEIVHREVDKVMRAVPVHRAPGDE